MQISRSTSFCLTFYFTSLAERTARIINNPVDLSTIPTEYHKFADVFSKAKAETLVLYHLYNLQIKLENEEKPHIGTIHLLLTTKQEINVFCKERWLPLFIYQLPKTQPYHVKG